MQHNPEDTKEAGPGASHIELFLLRFVRSNPGLRFGALVKAAQAGRRVPRTTTARHLARLVRLGDVTLLPDHTYVLGQSSTAPGRPVVEVRWYEVTSVLRPDGSARIFTEEEWRVVSGQLDNIEFTHPKPTRQFVWWCSEAGQLARIPAQRSPSRLAMHRIEWDRPLNPRKSSWERICVSRDLPRWYRMVREAGPEGRSPPSGEPLSQESDSVGLPSHGRRFGVRLAGDAHLRLMVVLPDGYPVGPIRCRVRFQAESGRTDTAEEHRLAKLGTDPWHQDGLRRFGPTLTLSIPQPLLDRDYQIEWALPDRTRRNLWLAGQRRALVALAGRPRRRRPRGTRPS
jgi:hypothetical protein